MNYGICSNGEVLTNEAGTALANFTIRDPKMFYEVENENILGVLRLMVLHRGESYQVDLDMRNPYLLQQLQREIPTCKILQPHARPHIEAHIMELPINNKEQQVASPLCFRQHGFHRLIDGTYVFVAGDEVLGLPNDREWLVTADTARAHLAYDKTLTLPQAVKGFWSVLKQNKNQLLPIWGFTLVSAMRSLLNRLNITIFPSCAVIGGQGNGKTTLCQRFSLLYDDTQRPGRRWAEMDAKSTAASTVDAISRYRDQVVLLDDLAKSISQAQMRKRKDLLADVLRFASNETDRSKMDCSRRLQEYFCTAGLIFTGEFSLNNPSDISRTVIVPINKQLQGGTQRDRVFAATAFRWFILWMLPRISEAVSGLAESLESVQGNNQRLKKNRMMILWALQQFLLFAQTSGAITEQRANKMMNYSIQTCDSILDEQIKQIDSLKVAGNLSWYILEGLQKKIIQAVSAKKIKKDEQRPEYYYVHIKGDETLYITTEILYRYLIEKTPICLTSAKDMDKRLIKEGIIHPRKEGRAAAKKISGRRYLELRRRDLITAANQEF